MDENIRGSILFYHNQIRDIQTTAEPQPAGMTLLEYDMELEEISICWAARCDNEYSECFITPRYAETSQSVIQLVLEEGQQPNVFLWMQVMNEWLGHVRSLSAETIQSVPAGSEGEKLHNYVQIMSDKILAIGCAWSLLNNILTMVCTYGPRGPMQGESVYKTGYPCSLCPGGYACDYVNPFEQLCKLRVYSAVSTPQDVPQYETPPLPPPLPSLPDFPSEDNQLAPPPPPMLPDGPEVDNLPSYATQSLLPAPPTPPGVTGIFTTKEIITTGIFPTKEIITTTPLNEFTTFEPPLRTGEISGYERQRIVDSSQLYLHLAFILFVL